MTEKIYFDTTSRRQFVERFYIISGLLRNTNWQIKHHWELIEKRRNLGYMYPLLETEGIPLMQRQAFCIKTLDLIQTCLKQDYFTPENKTEIFSQLPQLARTFIDPL